MKFHVVVPGDSVWRLARKYKISEARIIEVNGLEAQKYLVVGQALIIPVDEIKGKYGDIEANGFILTPTLAKESMNYLTYFTPFSYHVKEDGSLTDLNVTQYNKAANMLCVTNLNESNFDSVLIDKILQSDSLKNTLIDNIIKLVKQKKYHGVIIDFERIPPKDRELYNNFLRKLSDLIHNENKVLATALAPKINDNQTGAWHGAHDYKAHGEIADFVILMTYEWGWSGGQPMPVAPIKEVIKVINYAVSVIPRKKIIMGIPLYGYDWTLPFHPGGQFAKSIGCLEAVVRAQNVRAAIKYDFNSQSPYYTYYDKNRLGHIVWFEDARSIFSKLKLVKEYALRGVSYWTLGKPFPQNWYELDNLFKIKKY